MTEDPWRIDVHAHIGRFEGYDLSETTLRSEMAGSRIALALVSSIDGAAVAGKTLDLSEGEANERTSEAVQRDPHRLRGLVWCRPGSGDAASVAPFLERVLRPDIESPWTRRLFVGLKLHPEMNHFEADDPVVDPYLVLAEAAGIPVVVHSDARVDGASPERIVRLARRHPRVPVVLYHTGFHGPHEPAIEAAAEALDAGSADVYLETAQLPPDDALKALERVGPERVLFGTDATYFGPGHYARYRPLIEAIEARLPPDGRDLVFRKNALRLFRLEDG